MPTNSSSFSSFCLVHRSGSVNKTRWILCFSKRNSFLKFIIHLLRNGKMFVQRVNSDMCVTEGSLTLSTMLKHDVKRGVFGVLDISRRTKWLCKWMQTRVKTNGRGRYMREHLRGSNRDRTIEEFRVRDENMAMRLMA